MYYVIYTGAGKEDKTEEYIRRMVPKNLYDTCFHPVRKRNIKLGGKWHICFDCLIPGYIFLESKVIEDFYSEIRKNPAHLKILGKNTGDDSLSFYPLSDVEIEWLIRLTNFVPEKEENSNEEPREAGLETREAPALEKKEITPIAEISEVGFDENDKVVILSGPLKNLEGSIKKINLHKRIAEVEIDFMGRKTVVFMGIEILGNIH